MDEIYAEEIGKSSIRDQIKLMRTQIIPEKEQLKLSLLNKSQIHLSKRLAQPKRAINTKFLNERSAMNSKIHLHAHTDVSNLHWETLTSSDLIF